MNNEDVCVETAVDSSLQQSKLSIGFRSDSYQILRMNEDGTLLSPQNLAAHFE